jgi:hypothetical protein
LLFFHFVPSNQLPYHTLCNNLARDMCAVPYYIIKKGCDMLLFTFRQALICEAMSISSWAKIFFLFNKGAIFDTTWFLWVNFVRIQQQLVSPWEAFS